MVVQIFPGLAEPSHIVTTIKYNKVIHTMKLRLPAPNTFGTALILAVVLALAGYLLLPLFAAHPGNPLLFASGIGSGAFFGIVLSALRLEQAPATADSGEPKSVFVGNLAYHTSKEELQRLFAQYGTVRSVRIMTDRVTRRPRGFGFVEMDASGATAAIRALDGKEFHGRQLKVNEGKAREPQAA